MGVWRESGLRPVFFLIIRNSRIAKLRIQTWIRRSKMWVMNGSLNGIEVIGMMELQGRLMVIEIPFLCLLDGNRKKVLPNFRLDGEKVR